MSENTKQSKNKIYLPKKYVESKLKKTVTEEFKPYQLSEEIFKHLNPTNDEPILPEYILNLTSNIKINSS